MSTRSSIWLGEDKEDGGEIHIYWELAERIPRGAAPVYVEIEAKGRTTAFKLPKETAQQLLDALGHEGSWEII